MTSKVRVAVIGLGSMGRNHLRVLATMPEIEVVALCDSEPERLPSGPWTTLTDYREVAYENPDYCVIATPTVSHCEVASHFIAQGLPLLIEKPLARTAKEAKQILQKSQSENVEVAVGMIERFNQAVIEAKKTIELNRLGTLLKIATRRIGPPPGRDMGVGVLSDIGVHDLDLLQWVTGEKLKNLQCELISRVVTDRDDLALVSGRLSTGVLLQTEVSWLSPVKERSLELLFDSARVHFDLLTGEVVTLKQLGEENQWDAIRDLRGRIGSSSSAYAVKTVEPLLLMHQALLAAVSTSDWRPLPQVAESVDVLETIENLLSQEL